MEQHPVPQNVTTFQFRLIGEMTIKQFAYVAFGVMVAFIFYKLPFPSIITWPFAVASCLFGFGLAFVPIEERPMDVWVLSFLRSIYSPTLYVWQREEKMTTQKTTPPTQTLLSTQTPALAQKQEQIPSHTTLIQPKSVSTQELVTPTHAPVPISQPHITHQTKHTGGFFTWFTHLFAHTPQKTQVATPPPPPQPPINNPIPTPQTFIPIPSFTPSITGKHIDEPTEPEPKKEVQEQPQDQAKIAAIEEHNKELNSQLEKLKNDLTQKTTTDDRFLELQTQLTQLLSERQNMEDEIRSLRTKLTHAQSVASAPVRTAGTTSSDLPDKPTIKVITQETAVNAGLPRLTTTPNVITGICKDADNNLLPGVLVTVRDREGVPLRALKTNKLGQFAASTPLPDATYYIEVEDPRNRFAFDRIQITLSGTLLPAVEIKARSEKEITRQKIAQDLFGNKGL